MIIGSFTFISVPVNAQSEAPDLKGLLKQFQKVPLVTFQVEKKTKSELLGNETSALGTIYISSDKFRWDSHGKEKSKVIYDGKTIWTIQDPPEGFQVAPQVTKMKVSKKSEGQLVLKSLFSNKFESHFKILNKKKNNSKWVYKLAPSKEKSIFTELEVHIDSKNKIAEIAYVDEVQNKIQVLINKIEKSNKLNKKLFEYKPPTGAQVTEI